jgi:hypothetical protein
MRTLKYGYFDDMLIGNFARVELRNTALYPHVTPLVAKAAGSARIFTEAQLRRFRSHYFRRNPAVYLRHRLDVAAAGFVDTARHWADRLGIKGPIKSVYRRLLGDPAG